MRAFALVLAVLMGGAAVTAGQLHGMGVVQGRTTDASDEPVADVAVTATHTDTGNTLTGKSDAKGEWRVIGMARGQWELTFAKKGFEPLKAKATLESDQARTWPLAIKLKKAGS